MPDRDKSEPDQLEDGYEPKASDLANLRLDPTSHSLCVFISQDIVLWSFHIVDKDVGIKDIKFRHGVGFVEAESTRSRRALRRTHVSITMRHVTKKACHPFRVMSLVWQRLTTWRRMDRKKASGFLYRIECATKSWPLGSKLGAWPLFKKCALILRMVSCHDYLSQSWTQSHSTELRRTYHRGGLRTLILLIAILRVVSCYPQLAFQMVQWPGMENT
jgi:hypothetical protein